MVRLSTKPLFARDTRELELEHHIIWNCCGYAASGVLRNKIALCDAMDDLR